LLQTLMCAAAAAVYIAGLRSRGSVRHCLCTDGSINTTTGQGATRSAACQRSQESKVLGTASIAVDRLAVLSLTACGCQLAQYYKDFPAAGLLQQSLSRAALPANSLLHMMTWVTHLCEFD
jgi:hypothetical protein